MKGELPAGVNRLIDLALEEDLGEGDLTTRALVDPGGRGRAFLVPREECVVCGLEVAAAVFARLDPAVTLEELAEEGSVVPAGTPVARVAGPLPALLTGERTALNFLQRMCGVATLTRRYVEAAAGRTVVLDTRKTVPGWRWLDKKAVRAGGGRNHRMGLYDGVLIKDNHLAACGGVAASMRRVKERIPVPVEVEVEVDDLGQLSEALEAGVPRLLLDNFTPSQVAEAVRMAAGKAELEVSGGITLESLEPFLAAVAGVDYVSVGSLTHSAPAIDIGMDLEEEG